MNLIKLACGHRIVTSVMPMLQRPTNVHYIKCSTCNIASAWQRIVAIKEIPNELYPMFKQLPHVLSGWIMRLQSHTRRYNGFPYGGKR